MPLSALPGTAPFLAKAASGLARAMPLAHVSHLCCIALAFQGIFSWTFADRLSKHKAFRCAFVAFLYTAKNSCRLGARRLITQYTTPPRRAAWGCRGTACLLTLASSSNIHWPWRTIVPRKPYIEVARGRQRQVPYRARGERFYPQGHHIHPLDTPTQ